MTVSIKQIPAWLSLEIPTFNLVLNFSPFTTIKPVELSKEPAVDMINHTWIKLGLDGVYGLFKSDELFQARRCSVCGRMFDEEK